ncbi:YD repeat protein [Kutzneria albida DSM 43870]|uniref:YD repeat protein n=1 Tax=Kutzneria albida DSM 43870 TaxID=1449976 RepID=W5W014_9PSEU|nr:YD repeat protein [Kutzneria albida DSM 43870]
MSKINLNPEHMRRSGGKLADFGGKLTSGGQKLESAGQNLLSHASGDRSGFGSVISKAFGRGLQITGKVFGQGGRVVETAGKHLHTTANLHEEADHHGAGLLKRLHPDAKTSSHTGGGHSAGSRGGRSSSGTRTASARGHLGNNPRQHAIPNGKKCTGGDPVDMATGDVLFTETDLDLPGALPLVLSRTHLSSYRVGRLFGPSWASTLDQRLEIDEHGVVFVAADGMLLSYPTPTGQDAVLPVEGPRWPLRRTEYGHQVHDPDTGHTLHFDGDTSLQPLTAITDRAGGRIDIDHDSFGIPVQVRHSGGYHVNIRSHEGLITELVLPGETETVVRGFAYDEQRRLVEVVNGTGLALRLGYDAEGRLTRWTDRNDRSYQYTYDADGRCVRGESPDGFLSYTFDYDRDNLVTTATDSLGHATRYHLNDALQITAITDPLGGQTRLEFDRYDRLSSRTDPLGRTTRFERSDAGDLIRVTRPDGSQTVAEYNDFQLPIIIVNPDGAISRWEYDTTGAVVAETDALGATTRFGYDESHHLASVTDALGAMTRVVCDRAGLPVAVTDPLGATTTYVRDAFGRITAVTDPMGGRTELGWTAGGKLAWRREPDGAVQRWSYDGEGNQVEHIDALGQVSRTEYGAFDLPVAHVDRNGDRTAFTYNTELGLVAVTNPAGLVWRYDYDPAGNLIGETDFNGRITRYARDLAGQMVSRTNGAGQTITFTRDVLGRVVERRSDDDVTTLAYDAADRIVRATKRDADVVSAYDPLGRLVTQTTNGRAVSNAYDAVGHRVRRITPSGAETLWRYNLGGQLTSLDTASRTLEFTYDPAGREISRRVGTVMLAQTWDDNHRLRTQAVTAPSPAGQQQLLQRRAYTYRADDTVTNIVDQLAGVRHFDLDPLGRITQVEGASHRESYRYDASGNIEQAGRPDPNPELAEAPGTRQVTGTLLRTAGNVRYDYDGQGRVTTRQVRTLSGQLRTWHYAWDGDDRLTLVTTPDGVTWRYGYDAYGRRVHKQRLTADGRSAERTDFIWDGVTLAEQTHSSGHTTTWTHRPDGVIPLTQADRTPARNAPQDWIDQEFYAIVTDLIGAPTELVDDSGALVWRQDTTIWGTALAQFGRVECPLRFPGQYHDVETGHDYNLNRYYDPAAGAYLSPDPLGLDASPNPHGYVPNPVTWFDPLGLKCEPKRIYDDSSYKKHGRTERQTSRGVASRAPANGQAALDRSIDPDPGNPAVFRRYGVDHENNEIVVLDRHHFETGKDGNITKEYYHGHVPDPAKIPSKIMTMLKRAGMVGKKNNVLPPASD